MSKMNNQQRKQLCVLVDGKAKVEIEKIVTSDGVMIKLTSARLKEDKKYGPLDKEYQKLCKKIQKNRVETEKKIEALKDVLRKDEQKKDELRIAINLIGINTETGDVMHDNRYVGNYRNEKYKTIVYGENMDVWNSIKDGLEKDRQDIKDKAVLLKEKIWLCDLTQDAETLMRKG
jgi:hypothetical protein